jgi:NADPH:quinone reductase
MKAIRVHEFGTPEVMRLEETDDPRAGAGQVVVRARAIGVNPVDTYIRSGTYATIPPLPYTPGMDAAGEVEETGEGVKRVQAGERVYVAGSLSGTYAEKILCDESQVHPLPAHLSFAQGAGIYVPYATAYRALFHRAEAKPGEWVLIHGASGGVGTAAVQIARHAGMRVVGTGGTERGRELVREQGAHYTLDHRAPGYLDELMRLTEGRGVDVILEMLANVNLGRDLTVLAPRGRIVIIGSRGSVEIDPRQTMGRDASIHGMAMMNISPQEMASIHSAIAAGLENKTLNPIVGQKMPLQDAPRAHAAVLEPGAHGKIVLIP